MAKLHYKRRDEIEAELKELKEELKWKDAQIDNMQKTISKLEEQLKDKK